MADPACPPHLPPPSLDGLHGSLLVAVVFGCFLLGILTLQTYIYALSYNTDGRLLRYSVFILWGLDGLHSAFTIMMLYFYTVTHFFQPEFLAKSTWPFNASTTLTAITTGIVQTYFAQRAWKLDIYKKRWLTLSICFLTFCQVAFGLICGVKSWVQFHELTRYNGTEPKFLVSFWLGTSALCDILISISLVSTLSKAKTGFSKTDGAIERIIKFSVNTGILTSLFAIIAVCCFAVLDNLVHLIFNFTLAKLYTNTMLATLNSRRKSNGHEGIFQPTSSSSRGGGVTPGVQVSHLIAPAPKLNRLRSALGRDSSSKAANDNRIQMVGGVVSVTTHTIRHEDPLDNYDFEHASDTKPGASFGNPI